MSEGFSSSIAVLEYNICKLPLVLEMPVSTFECHTEMHLPMHLSCAGDRQDSSLSRGDKLGFDG